MDEPNAFLDEEGETALVNVLLELRTEGIGALVSTHRPSVARAADKLLVLRDGSVQHFGDRQTALRALSGPTFRVLRSAARQATA